MDGNGQTFSKNLKIIAGAFIILLALLVVVVGPAITQHRDDRLFTTICTLNNIVKADSRWRVEQAKSAFGSKEAWQREFDRENNLLVILDCEATFTQAGGRAVPLSPTQDRKFVEIIGTGQIPIVKHGQIVDIRPPESGPLADF